MKKIPANLIIEKNKLAANSAWLILLDIELKDGTVFRLARNNEDVLYPPGISPENLRAHWKFEETSGTNVADETDNSNLTASVDASLLTTTGVMGNAFKFTGTQVVNTANIGTLNTSNVSYSIWFNWDGTTGGSQIVFLLGDSMNLGVLPGIPSFHWSINIDGLPFTLPLGSMTANQWYHVVVTYDGSNVIGYVNGSPADTAARTGPISYADNTLIVGASTLGSAHPFHGKVDDFRIYHRVLSPAEVSDMYNNGSGSAGKSQTYTAFNFEIEPTEQSGKGEIPSVTLRVSNITKLIQPYLEALDGGIGSEVKITVVNSAYLDEDYKELEMTFDVIDCSSSAQWVTFTLGAPNPLRQMLLPDKFLALHCNWLYNDIVNQQGFECGYVPRDIIGITKAANAKVGCTAHKFAAGDSVKFYDVSGMEEINGLTATVQLADPDADGNAFTVDIDSTGFTTYTSGGNVGFTGCKRTLTDCRQRENETRFGGYAGMRSGGIRIA